MTWPAALPAAALRVMRSAAGRRALQVMVLVGGLFALGFLCGEQAHAASEAPGTASSAAGPVVPVAPTSTSASTDGVGASLKDVVGSLVTAPATLVDALTASPGQLGPAAPRKPRPHAPAGHGRPEDSARPKPAGAPAPAPAPAQPTPQPKSESESKPQPTSPAGEPPADGPASDGSPADSATPAPVIPVLGPVVDGVVRTVDDAVLRPVGDLVVTVTGELVEATAPITQLPSLPSAPELPGAPSLPGQPGVPSVPGQTLPAPVPQPDGPRHSATASGERPAGKRAQTAAYGPRADEAGCTAHALAPGDGRRAAHGAGYAPVPQTPGGDPTGVLSNRSAVDSGTPRHGDAQAVALNQPAPLRPLSGAAARAHGDATWDRHQDIPVSPA